MAELTFRTASRRVQAPIVAFIVLCVICDAVIMYSTYVTGQEWWMVPLVMVPIQYLIVKSCLPGGPVNGRW